MKPIAALLRKMFKLRQEPILMQREKVMRTHEKPATVILTGMQIYHNHVRPHEALEGRTAAEVAGIRVEGTDKWLTLI